MKNDFDVSGPNLLTFIAGTLTGAAAALLLARGEGDSRRGLVAARIRDGLRHGRGKRLHLRAKARTGQGADAAPLESGRGNAGEPSGS
jgi:hypothetical protein